MESEDQKNEQGWGRGDRRDRREDDVHTTAVRAGKRTYFFDIRSTRGKDLYLTITESKRQTNASGDVTYQKHKLFLYKEDFEKFSDGLKETLSMVAELQASGEYQSADAADFRKNNSEEKESPASDTPASGDVSFEDLD